ncbi:MAG: UDP-N-acetylglucosamine 1-carboxyvinyltransferase [Pseudomonadota bacterium]|nr:UDP-N-acetylglucosamine 1-carboxyvinyltransferase [Pseudomonadota bacterium]
MYAFKINGGKKLSGTVRVKGAKNAILPLMTAALLTDEPIVLHNISYLSDVVTLSELLKNMGADITSDSDSITIRCHQITSTTAPYDYVSKMRATFWVLGPLLGRFHEAKVSLPGGCAIGARPVDLYIKALEEMGADIGIENGYVVAKGHLKAAEIFFPKISVGATHNTIMAAVLTPGITVIHNPALEPEALDLIHLLQKMGANITGVGTRTLTITGVKKLHGATHTIVADRIETATFAVGAALTRGKIMIEGGCLDLMQAVADTMIPSGIDFLQTENGLWVDATQATLTATPIITSEYPGFPTDSQPLLTTLLSVSQGDSLVTERIYENRFMHVPELNRMGANIEIIDNKTVLIHGVPHLSGAIVTSSDLRGGVGLVLAGLAATGETTVQRVYHIDRGYDHIEDKLAALGADIVRFKQ